MLEHTSLSEQTRPYEGAREAQTDRAFEEMRATPEEVALAAAALEARRAAQDRHREATLPLTQAIDQLGLNATPEELWPEVETIRTERAARQESENDRLVRRSAGLGVAIGLALAVVLIWADVRGKPSPVAQAASLLTVSKLSSVPEGVPVHMDSVTLQKAVYKQRDEDLPVDGRPETTPAAAFANEWKVVKRGAALVVQGWATPDAALQLANDQPSAIFSSRPPWFAQSAVVPIEVPAYRVVSEDYEGNSIGFGPTGALAGAAGVVRGASVEPSVEAAKRIVEHRLKNANDIWSFYDPVKNPYSVSVDSKGTTVQISGNVKTDRLKQKATKLASEALRDAGSPTTVENQTVVGPE